MIVESVSALRASCDAARSGGATVGLVPTMGYLHEGHRSLMRAARRECDFVVTSIFVNPLQFGAGEDLDHYPRDLDADVAACRAEGIDAVFHPSAQEMFPDGSPATSVHVDGLTRDLCGRARPGHFEGVTTVVAKLLGLTGRCRAYFGRKDYQQLQVVRRMVADLELDAEIVGCPLVREPDGLALSSRNAYLDAAQRISATALSRVLREGAARVVAGARDATVLRDEMLDILGAEGIDPEYLEVRSALDLVRVDVLKGEVVIAIAARFGSTRLIDNVLLDCEREPPLIDLGVGGPDPS